MRKILFLTNRLPFPNTDGRKNILMQYISSIKDIHPDVEIVNYSFLDDVSYLNEKPETIAKVNLLERPSFIEKIYNFLIYTFLLRQWPLQVSLYYSRKTQRTLNQAVQMESPDLIFIDMIRVAEYVRHQKIKRIMNYDDLLSLRYQRQQQFVKYVPNLLGGIASKFPKMLRKLIDFKTVQKMILKFEGDLLNKYERQIAPEFDHLVFTSPKEASDFGLTVNHRSCLGIPMNVSQSSFEKMRKYDEGKVVFVGRMDIPHNVASVIYFCHDVWPQIKEKKPNATFYIIGKSPNEEVKELSRKFEDVVVTGQVENIEAAIKDAAVFVAPILFGTGIKTKVIEAMSFRLPVVATSVAAEGILYNQGENMLVTDNANEFAEFVIRIMEDLDYNLYLGEEGNRLIERYFSKDQEIEKWKKILKSVS